MNAIQKEALARMEKYCAYQERCHLEAEQKLRELGFYGDEAGMIILELIQHGFLNEERFSRSFCRGKFRMKKWGRRKLVQELKSRNISDYCIRMGLKEINDLEYYQGLRQLAVKKLDSLKGTEDKPTRYKKTSSYLFQKGYEPDMIREILKELTQV